MSRLEASNIVNVEQRQCAEDDWTCAICLHIVQKPLDLGVCRHLFCQQCFLDIRADADCSRPCPLCAKRVTFAAPDPPLHDSIISRIDALKVCCVQRKRGCNWADRWGQHADHAWSCDYRDVFCSECHVEFPLMERKIHERTDMHVARMMERKSCPMQNPPVLTSWDDRPSRVSFTNYGGDTVVATYPLLPFSEGCHVEHCFVVRGFRFRLCDEPVEFHIHKRSGDEQVHLWVKSSHQQPIAFNLWLEQTENVRSYQRFAFVKACIAPDNSRDRFWHVYSLGMQEALRLNAYHSETDQVNLHVSFCRVLPS